MLFFVIVFDKYSVKPPGNSLKLASDFKYKISNALLLLIVARFNH